MYLSTEQLKIFIIPEIIKAFKLKNLDNIRLNRRNFYYEVNICPKIFCYALNNKDVKALVRDEAFIKNLEMEINASVRFSDTEKNIMIDNIVLLLLVILLCGSDNAVKAIVLDMAEISNNFKTRLSKFLIGCREVFIPLFVDTDSSSRFFADLVSFHRTIATYVTMKTQEVVLSSVFQRMILPPYIPSTLKNRIFLCMLLPDEQKMRTYIQNLTFPRSYLIPSILQGPDRIIHPYLFKQLVKYIPNRLKLESEALVDFERFIWKTHIHRPQQLIKMCPKYKHRKIDIMFKQSELIAQIIAFSQSNWKQLWFYMRWPCMPEIVKRLYFLKENTNWKIDSEKIVGYLLSIKS